jgi:hypothetical protein
MTIENKILEKEILKDVCEYLETNKVLFWRANNIPVYGKNNAGKYMYRSLPKYTPRGLPDIIAVIHGICVGIEIKRPDRTLGKLSPEQADFGLKLNMAGGVYFVARCVGDVQKCLDMYARKFPSPVPVLDKFPLQR